MIPDVPFRREPGGRFVITSIFSMLPAGPEKEEVHFVEE
jgi:hypothetical protein